MSRETILEEIRRAAAANGGIAPGQRQFEKLTGISSGKWRGKFWLRWSDAMSEAGLTPGRMVEAYAQDVVLAHLAGLTRKCGHFPTYAELRMERGRDKSFPNHSVFNRLGDYHARISQLRTFANERIEFADILSLLPGAETVDAAESSTPVEAEAFGDGYVYMLKLGKHYKIGKTFSVPRRHREIALELPEKPDVVHSIRTDDPDGIEAYWHRRFDHKRTNGEWFSLDLDDVRAFKRRKFM